MAGTGEAIDPTGGSAATQGDLWAERARDWAEVMEGWNGWGVPLYRQVLERLRVGTGTKLLDVGCGPVGSAASRPIEVRGSRGSTPPPRSSRSRGNETVVATSASATWRRCRGPTTPSTW